ncbi:MAG: tryptophan-rich sensory protein [Opitutaceae bacterium]|nr:tryptophan-rich sensory protein [Opitutaceae bacterium]
MTTYLRRILPLVGWVALAFSASITAVFVSTEGWYAALNKPTWNPPPWLFGPVWSTLYVAMGVSAWLVWRQGGWSQQRHRLTLFLVQWALNALWTPLFFGLHQIGLALADIIVLWLAIVATIASFARVSQVAAALLVPYLAWVSFATFLTFTIWRLN